MNKREHAKARTKNFKHYSHCVNCGEMVVHMGQKDGLTGEDVWHLRTEGRGFEQEIYWTTHCYRGVDHE